MVVVDMNTEEVEVNGVMIVEIVVAEGAPRIEVEVDMEANVAVTVVNAEAMGATVVVMEEIEVVMVAIGEATVTF